jgi:ADP-heptose:LPS heptosyltransferase
MRNNQFPYRDIIDHYGKENVVFISSSENDYNEFPFNNEIEFYKVTTLDEWFTTINSAGLVIANLSAPAVMASALDKPRIIELPDRGDRAHYIGEEKYSKNAYWFLTSQIHNI